MKLKRITALTLAFLLACVPLSGTARAETADVPYSNYTYNYWGEVCEAPAAYEPYQQIELNALGQGSYKFPSNLFIDSNGNIVITDRENNRILSYDNNWQFRWEIREFDNNGVSDSLNNPNDAVVDQEGNIYIVDTDNGRILKFDADRRLIAVFGKPESDLLSADLEYKPYKIAVDYMSRMFVIIQNVTDGIMSLDKRGRFMGFIGAPKVKPDFAELFWRSISTKEQQKRMGQFIPTEYNSIAINSKGFLYCTTAALNAQDLTSAIVNRSTDDRFAPVKKLNAAGVDVLVRRGYFPPNGDVRIPNISLPGAPIFKINGKTLTDSIMGTSQFVDVAVGDNGMYYVLDRNRSRVFCYSKEGELLYLFGGPGVREGSVSDPVAIDYYNGKIYILNSQKGMVNIYAPTKYGATINSAVRNQDLGNYEQSTQDWQAALSMNRNFELAYTAIGKIYRSSGESEKALEYFRLGNSIENYSKALKMVRNDFVNRYFFAIVFGILAVIILFHFIKKLIRKNAHKENLFGHFCKETCFSFRILFHPIASFWEIKSAGGGSVVTASVLYLLSTVVMVLSQTASAYVFTGTTNPLYINAVVTAVTALLPLLLWCVSNWCLTTLMDGEGTFKQIYMFTGYAQLPIILFTFAAVLVSHCLTLDESVVYTTLMTVPSLWMYALVILGTMIIHDYSLKKTVLTCVCTIVGIFAIIFVGLLLTGVIDQIKQFVTVIIEEISYR